MMANRVAVVGHSHVRRLEEHCNGDNLSLNNLQIRFFSRGGLTVPQLFDRDILTPLLAFRPQGLVLLIGDNDIQPSSSPHQIGHSILRAIDDIKQACPSIRFVSISQILPRHAGTSRYYFSGYNDIAFNVNRFLLQECINSASTTLRLCRYKEFDFNAARLQINQKLFLRDGVHLNYDGYVTLADRIKGAVIGIHKKLKSNV